MTVPRGSGLAYRLAVVDIDSRDIVAGDGVSLPAQTISKKSLSTCWKGHLSKPFPLVFHFNRLATPLLADDLGYFRIGKSGVTCNYLSLIMLSVENEG
jgi:hypothetical protein